jgi:hypothetical protein
MGARAKTVTLSDNQDASGGDDPIPRGSFEPRKGARLVAGKLGSMPTRLPPL